MQDFSEIARTLFNLAEHSNEPNQRPVKDITFERKVTKVVRKSSIILFLGVCVP